MILQFHTYKALPKYCLKKSSVPHYHEPPCLFRSALAQTFNSGAKTEGRPFIYFQEGETTLFLVMLHLYFLNSYDWVD